MDFPILRRALKCLTVVVLPAVMAAALLAAVAMALLLAVAGCTVVHVSVVPVNPAVVATAPPRAVTITAAGSSKVVP